MKRTSTLLAALAVFAFGCQAQLQLTGGSLPALSFKPEGSSTGLEAVLVAYDTNGMRAEYTASSPSATVSWSRFSSLGGGYAEVIPSSKEGVVSYITLGNDDMGYIIEEGNTRHCYWIVNYQNHQCSLNGLSISAEQDCSSTALLFEGSAEKIPYYSINGAQKTLSRELQLTYTSLEFNDEQQLFQPAELTETLEAIGNEIHVAAPLTDTEFTLRGDRFLQAWGQEQSVVSPLFNTPAVAAQTWAVQQQRENDNEQRVETAYGGSAPVDITFSAAVTDAVVYREWQIASSPEFDVIDLRINEDEYSHTFRDYGTWYVRFVCGNATGTCDYTGETYEVFIGESRLEIPNVFSPNDDSVNDVWKVSYKSLISFDCHIFNRWGLEMAHLTDASQGWDGRYNGKKVPSGAYYYTIDARGSDGKHYKKAGDINIIGSSLERSSGSSDAN